MKRLIGTAMIVMLAAMTCAAQDEKEYTLEGVVVTGSRLPMGSAGARHTVAVIDRAEIERLPSRSVDELLQTVAGVDVRQRGAFGVQADVGIRGGTFEQTLVMIDGVKMIDAQTGHHNFNIPLTSADIERIEVLKGPGSRQYGPNAFNGAVNIITRKHETSSARAEVMGGEHGLWEGLVSAALPFGPLTNSVSFSKKRADGYRPNTDFDITTANAAAGLAAGASGSVNAQVSYLEKKFGANGFYSTRFPNQFEHTRTFVAMLTGKAAGSLPVTANAFYRRNNDYYILKREDPKFYENTHADDSYGGEAQASFASGLGLTAVGTEAANEGIESTRLGSHRRTRARLFAEHQIGIADGLTLEAGGSAQWYSDWKWSIAPGADLGWTATEHLRLYASAGRSFRVPTYTELYYSDPSTLGNPGLKPEEAWTYEVGSVWAGERFSCSASYFFRRGTNLIDFTRTSGTAPWAANNISDANTNGFDLAVTLPLARYAPLAEELRLSYTYTDIAFATAGGTSRYVLDNLRHHAVGTLSLAWSDALRQTITARYEDRLGYMPKTLVDTRLGWRFASFEIYGEVSNLFNASVVDIAGTPLAGRWARAGAAVTLGAP